jgi:twitching motility protein PilT
MQRVEKLEDLLQEMVDRGASDLFLKAGTRPAMRIDGEIVLTDYGELTMDDTQNFALQLMTPEQAEYFARMWEMDLAVGVRGVGRFRVNIFRQRSSVGLVFRYISNPTFSFDELNLPPVIKTLAEKRRGLILVTGTTGSGKSTTLAAMINHINQTRRCHIVTIEDPIEFLHQDELAIINQREVGFDTKSFSDALKHIMRQAPDVILIGEMRDLETISTAIAAAQTGHLVLSTLHTIDAVQTVERIINYFPAYLHPQIRMELAFCLQGVICQRLLPLASGRGRIPAVEVMVSTPTIRKLLHEGKTLELPTHIEAGAHVGMQTFNQSLLQLYRMKKIRLEDALLYASSPDEFRLMVEGIASGVRAREMGSIYG